MALKGKKLTSEHKKKLSEVHKGQVPWNKGKKTGIGYWKGKKRSEEAKKKMSEAQKKIDKYWMRGRIVTKETREKIRQSLLGRKQSEETKKKRSLALKGRSTSRKGIKHTKEAKIKMRRIAKRYSGKNHYCWKGGVSTLAVKIRKSCYYKDWREAVFERDNYTCQDCGISNTYLIAHHEKEFSKILEDNNIKNFKDALACDELWDINNGKTVCEKCHKKRHPKVNLLCQKIKL